MSVYVPKTMIGRAGLAAWRQVGREETSLVDAVVILGSIRAPDMELARRVAVTLNIHAMEVDLVWTRMIDAILAELPAEEKAQVEHGVLPDPEGNDGAGIGTAPAMIDIDTLGDAVRGAPVYRFEEDGRGGCLYLGIYPIAILTPAGGGHVVDTGHTIARLLNEDAKRRNP